MEEFDLDLNNMVGTKVSSLKDNADVDTDIDYDNILDNLQISETNNCSSGMCGKPMNNFVKKVEKNLDNYSNPLPANYTKNMESQNKLQTILPSEIANVVEPPKEKPNDTKNTFSDITCKITKLLNNEIFIYVLLFLLLNNNFVVNIINKIPQIVKLEKLHLNLLIRTVIFGVVIYFLKSNKILNI